MLSIACYFSGSMLLKDVDVVFGRMEKEISFNRNNLKLELENLYRIACEFTLKEGQKSKHFKLLNNYYTLKQNLRGAKMLKQMEEILDLAGDFTVLDQILVRAQFVAGLLLRG